MFAFGRTGVLSDIVSFIPRFREKLKNEMRIELTTRLEVNFRVRIGIWIFSRAIIAGATHVIIVQIQVIDKHVFLGNHRTGLLYGRSVVPTAINVIGNGLQKS